MWKELEVLERKDLPKSVISEAMKIYDKAKDDQRGERGVWGIGRGCRFRICETASLANFKES